MASLDAAHYLVTYTSFITPGVDANLFIITSRGALSAADKAKAVAHVELDCPTLDGSVELIARAWHDQYTLHAVYCKQEDLLLRAAHLRRLMGIAEGMQPENTLTFRDKHLMKDLAVAHKFPVPKYQRLDSPSCLLAFIDRVGLPVVVKPTLGSASAGIHVLRTMTDVATYLRTVYFGHLASASAVGQFDTAGQLLAEAYLADAPMYHVNGFVDNGNMVAVWPFQYLRTNLEFTHGAAYGNVSLPETDDMYKAVVDAAKRALACFTLPTRCVFHLELFHVSSSIHNDRIEHPARGQDAYFALCEVAARRPGGSIADLISRILGVPFAPVEFRFNAGLDYTLPHRDGPAPRIGDLLVPLRTQSRVLAMPSRATFPLGSNVAYIPLARSGLEYRGFSVGTLNTAARFVATGTEYATMVRDLGMAETWFARNVVYTPLPSESSTTTVVKARKAHPLVRKLVARDQRVYVKTHAIVVARRAPALLRKVVAKVHARDAEERQLVKARTVSAGHTRRPVAVALAARMSMRAHAGDAVKSRALVRIGGSTAPSSVAVYARKPAFALARKAWRRAVVAHYHALKTGSTKKRVLMLEAAPTPKGAVVSTHPAKSRAATAIAMVKKVQSKHGSSGIDWMGGMRYVVVPGKGNGMAATPAAGIKKGAQTNAKVKGAGVGPQAAERVHAGKAGL
ncbi:hypothetical protein AMAG_17344 [Allomyces macrogynus ATCC 38327]|uniref:ATP-grasp domain-containing protein n=1 Tax=Allomyces macrogynus (strain ATCC 38327) TaxID=578462 RepID=A0A0L0TEG4_ALLM3|nr:hypothetical protein AMAG_17344 [Allomyces macrogynus ATCC 38327]|eukprot:KNE73147.1 hypothetical protein AMAG_17344 [Allomyces macrogynus ATCC 38327]